MRVQNRWTKVIGTGAGLVLLLASAAGFAEPPSNALLDRLGNMPVYSIQRLSILSDQYGPRPAGSTLLEAAFDWAFRSLKDDGLTRVQRQTVPIQGFIGGTGTLTRTSNGTPTQGVPVLPLGGTTGTPPEGVEGPLLSVSSLDELELTPREQIRGAIVLLNQPMENREDLSPLEAYQRAVKARLKGPALAALRGAKGVVVRSITPASLGTLHGGITEFPSHLPAIPAVSITLEEADRLTRLARGGTVQVRLQVHVAPPERTMSQNITGEIRGRELPEEIILIGVHLDTWHQGDGSADNGCGVAMAMDAMRMINRLPRRPRRTIRLALFTDEEQHLAGAKAYQAEYGNQQHRVVVEPDLGCGKPRALMVSGSSAQRNWLEAHLAHLSPFGIERVQPGGTGANVAPLVTPSTWGIGFLPHLDGYFEVHHSAGDTFEKIDLESLEQHTRILATLLWLLGEEDVP